MNARPRSLLLLATALASAALAAAACGGGHHGGGSAPTPTPTATGTPAAVHVALPPSAMPGLVLAVEDSSGAVVSSGALSTAGADVFVPAGGSLTVYMDLGIQRDAWHVIEPPPGATVFLPDPVSNTVSPSAVTSGNVTISDIAAGATQVEWAGPCASGVSGVPLVQTGVQLECGLTSTFNVFALARNNTNNSFAWGLDADVAASPGNTLNIAVSATNKSFDLFRLAATNIPGGVTVSGYASGYRGPLDTFSGITTIANLIGVTQGTAARLTYPAAAASVVTESLYASRSPASPFEIVRLRSPADGSLTSVDVGAFMAEMPALAPPVVGNDAHGSPSVFWAVSSTPLDVQFVDAEVIWSSSGSASVSHKFWLPAGRISVAFPQVPAGMEGFQPTPNMQILSSFVQTGARSDAASYADALAAGGLATPRPTAVTTPIVLKKSMAYSN